MKSVYSMLDINVKNLRSFIDSVGLFQNKLEAYKIVKVCIFADSTSKI